MTESKQTTQPPVFRLDFITLGIGLLGGFLLMGIPGALLLELLTWASSYLGMSPLNLPADSVWPFSIMISLLWPTPIISLSMYQNKKFPQQSIYMRWIFNLLGSLLMTVVLIYLLLI